MCNSAEALEETGMDKETSRRNFVLGGAAATAALAAGAAQGADEIHKHQHDPKKHPHDHQEFPRDRPGPGGPVGSATDRGKLVPGRRGAGEPPVPVETPD